MKVKFGLLIIAFVLINLALVTASITLSNPENIYNYGDTFKTQAKVLATKDSAGFFELSLKCNQTNNFYKQYLNLKAKDEKVIDAEILLLPSLIDKGNCIVEASFSQDTEEGKSFVISSKIDIDLESYTEEVEAGKTILITGKAEKENGNDVKGFYELAIDNSSSDISGNADLGFNINFSFPENAKSGIYIARLKVYESLYGEITNSGGGYLEFFINQTPKSIKLEIPESVIPGESINFNAELHDQAQDKIDSEVSVVFNNNRGFKIERQVSSKQEISFDTNASLGGWTIEAGYGNLVSRKNFTMLELMKASFEIVNNNLIVKNIGNVPYNKQIEISIGDYKETKNIMIETGEEMKFKLNAPDGEYNVKVSDGISQVENTVALTGKSISIDQLSGIGLIMRYPIVWIFLILVLGMMIVLYSRRVIKRTSYSVPVEKKDEVVSRAQEKRGFEIVDIASSHPEKAEHSLVLEGRKELASLIAIKIANIDKIRKVSAETLASLFKLITESKGSVFESNDFIIGVFSSLNTRTFRNEMPALNVARKIETLLKEHNRKFREKIDYGVGLSLGEIIAKRDKDLSLKFTALGNSLNQAKKTAEFASSELLLAENMQKKVAGEVRTERVVKDGVNLYSIKAVMDRDKNKEFISSFLDRQRKS